MSRKGPLLIANKPVYGTRDAPRGFWRRLHNVRQEKGLTTCTPRTRGLCSSNQGDGISGILVSHV